MTQNPSDRKYTKEHEWVKVEGSTAVVGITFHSQELLTDIFFVELPKKTEKTAQFQGNEKADWSVDKGGYLVYPSDRGTVLFNREDYNQTDVLLISRIIYQSRNGNIYGLLVLPKYTSEPLPGVVLLPGAGVSKESELGLAKKIAQLGAAVLTIDQRGTGETDGNFPNLDQDFAIFLNGQEPYQHLMIYDALRGYDLLHDAPFVDPDRIIMAGESLGGRIAIIATAIEKNIHGALIISSSGFNFRDGNDTNKNMFIKSIDSDHYVNLITPRKIVFIHNINDRVISVSSATRSYFKAADPKKIFLINDTGCNHGYCNMMNDSLVEGLDFLIGIKSKTVAEI